MTRLQRLHLNTNHLAKCQSISSRKCSFRRSRCQHRWVRAPVAHAELSPTALLLLFFVSARFLIGDRCRLMEISSFHTINATNDSCGIARTWKWGEENVDFCRRRRRCYGGEERENVEIEMRDGVREARAFAKSSMMRGSTRNERNVKVEGENISINFNHSHIWVRNYILAYLERVENEEKQESLIRNEGKIFPMSSCWQSTTDCSKWVTKCAPC